jgi:hypothetical protein
MLKIILIAAALVAGTVAVHAAGSALVLSLLGRQRARPPARLWPMTLVLIEVAWLLLLLHAIEITGWALAYLWAGCLPDLESAVYFSGVTYTTIGYGDVVLPKPWRLYGPLEGATGILVIGLSTGLFFAILVKIFAPQVMNDDQAPTVPASPADRQKQ